MLQRQRLHDRCQIHSVHSNFTRGQFCAHVVFVVACTARKVIKHVTSDFHVFDIDPDVQMTNELSKRCAIVCCSRGGGGGGVVFPLRCFVFVFVFCRKVFITLAFPLSIFFLFWRECYTCHSTKIVLSLLRNNRCSWLACIHNEFDQCHWKH